MSFTTEQPKTENRPCHCCKGSGGPTAIHSGLHYCRSCLQVIREEEALAAKYANRRPKCSYRGSDHKEDQRQTRSGSGR
jgi:late competence protein required for DNA uptake (superfamily II DNA/RNA helicase)